MVEPANLMKYLMEIDVIRSVDGAPLAVLRKDDQDQPWITRATPTCLRLSASLLGDALAAIVMETSFD
jgi:hypothetical protein